TVIVQRQPIPGASVGATDRVGIGISFGMTPEFGATDRVGIGISFGMTAKGDVFITGMAPTGPAKASGQVRRGDQLTSVDGVDIKGWDVKDIVNLIVGQQGSFVRLHGSFVRLETACLPDDHVSPEPSRSRN
ncbi:hypothetical protein T484DRAFT_1858482, partial [Baffinella frigidus]